MQGRVILKIHALTCLFDAELGYAQLLHTVVYSEELVVGKLVVLLLSGALDLLIFCILDRAKQLFYAHFYERKKDYDCLEYAEQNLGDAPLSAGKEVGDVDCKDRYGDYHKSDSAEYLDEAEAYDTADESAAYRALAVLEELYRIKYDLVVPIGDRICES